MKDPESRSKIDNTDLVDELTFIIINLSVRFGSEADTMVANGKGNQVRPLATCSARTKTSRRESNGVADATLG